MNTPEKSRVEASVELRLKLLLEQTPTLLVIVQEKAEEVLWMEGKGLLAFSFKAEEQVIGVSFAQLFREYLSIPIDFRRALAGESFVSLIKLEKGFVDAYYAPFPSGEEGGKQAYLIGTYFSEQPDSLKEFIQEKETLVQEMHHRIKNNLQVISSLIHLQSSHIQDSKAILMFKDIQNRLKSMALIHEKLYLSPKAVEIDFDSYIKTLMKYLCQSYKIRSDTLRIQVLVEPLLLNIDTALPCGLIVHELVSNALKYAFPEGFHGTHQIDIILESIEPQRLCLRVEDNGVGFAEPLNLKNLKSFGLQLVQMLVEQLEGTLAFHQDQKKQFLICFQANYRKKG